MPSSSGPWTARSPTPSGLVLGVFLQAVNALAVAGIGIGFQRVLPVGVRRLALGHLVLRVVEAVVIIGLGAWMLATESLVDYEPGLHRSQGRCSTPRRSRQ